MANNNSPTPPEVMTWKKATVVILIAIVFDAVRAFFDMFWFFGPVLAAYYCTSTTNAALNTTTAGVIGKTVAAGCTAAAGTAGFFTSEILTPFGVLMAMAIGFAGWLVIGFIVMTTDFRLVRENGFRLTLGLIGSEIPFINMFPVLSGTVITLYARQIKQDAAALKAYNAAQAANALKERQEQARVAAAFVQQQAQEEEAVQQQAQEDEMPQEEENQARDEAAPDERYAAPQKPAYTINMNADAANEDSYIPENMRNAA